MSSPPRRSGFRLPWSSPDRDPDKADGDGAAVADAPDRPIAASDESAGVESARAAELPSAGDTEPPPAEAGAPAEESTAEAEPAVAEDEPAVAEAEPAVAEAEPAVAETAATRGGEAAPADAADAAEAAPTEEAGEEPAVETPRDLLSDLVAAMRGVAEQAREADVRDLGPRVEERLARFRSDAEEEATALRERAEADVTAIGEWERSEAERIRAEAEARVAARRQQLEEQLAANEHRATGGTDEVRRRVADYERRLEEFFTQLREITDPAAFAAKAKAMPRPPEIEEVAGAPSEDTADTEGDPAAAALSESGGSPVAHATAGSTVVVKGLTSFGSITAFKQSLEAVDGVSSVTLSLGPTGEFVYRAVHNEGFDLVGAITSMERGSAAVERQEDGTLQVTVARGR